MWNPEARYANTSYREPLPDPGTNLINATQVSCLFPATAIPYVVGALLQLLQPPAWSITDRSRLLEVLGQVNDLILIFGTAGAPMQIQLSATGVLQTSNDGGSTWTDVSGWVDNLPDTVRRLQARVLMEPDTYPPVPQETPDGTDWLYSDHAEG